MKIIRDGKEIELTDSEIYDAYKEYHNDCLKEDVLGTIAQMEVEVPDELMDKVIARAEKVIGNNESYYESYWMSIEYAIEDVLENN